MATYDWSLVVREFGLFLPAAWLTLKLTVLAILGGTGLGLLAALARLSRRRWLQAPVGLYVYVVRGTPLLLQIFLLYYGMTSILTLPDFTAAVLAFALHNGAYLTEIFRGAIISIDPGQGEAARAVGMSAWQTMRRIILPQALKRAVPPLSNQFIIALKDTSLASTIAIRELLLQAKQYGSSTYHFMEYLVLAGLYYLLMTTVLTYLAGWLEKRTGKHV